MLFPKRLPVIVAVVSMGLFASAFVAFEHPETAFEFAQRTMRDMLRLEVPVRVGIGDGSFRALRFKTDTGDRIGLHASYFLGTSVTRAHAADRAGSQE